MIIDQLCFAACYAALHPRIATALRYLTTTALHRVPCGRHVIEGDACFVLVQEYQSKPVAEGFWEAHRRYTDIQVIIAGAERIGYAPVSRLRLEREDPEKDLAVYSGDGDFLELHAGDFMILGPRDGHMPGLLIEAPALVRKAVVKVEVPDGEWERLSVTQ